MKGSEYYDKIYNEPYYWEAYLPLYKRIAGYLPENKNARIFDVGCGTGGFLKVCKDLGYTNLWAWDFSEVAVAKARELVPEAKIYDVHKRMPDQRYDCIVMIEFLEHLDEDIKELSLYYKNLLPGGFILGSVPNEQMPPEVTKAHVRMYDERTFMERFNLPGRILVKTNFIIFKFLRRKDIYRPLISFVVPAYMGDHYLNETVESLVNQTEENIEIIVVNDASPDYTEDLMKWWVKQDDRIKYYSLKENKGVVYARNFGNKKARAEIIGVSDQDDISMPERARITLEAFRKKPKINMLYSSYHECDVDGEPLTFYEAEKMNREIFEQKKWKTWFHSSAAYRKKDILKLPYKKRDGCTDDWILLDTWTKAGMVFHPIKEVLANCRRLPTGVMAQRRKQAGAGPNYFL